MAIYLISGHTELPKIAEKIEGIYPDQHYALSPASWFVFDIQTAQEVATKLGIRGGELGAEGVVTGVSVWSGFGPTAMWDWLRSRLEDKSSG